MPYTAKQKRTFQAAAHSPSFARKIGIPQGDAKKLAEEAAATRTRPPVKGKKK